MSDIQTASAGISVDVKELLEAGCHFGHQAKRWNPKMKDFIYTEKNGVHIFDLIKTGKQLETAMEFVRDLAASGKTMVFIGTKRQAQDIIKAEAVRVGAPFVTVRWLGGTITNWEQVNKSIEKLLTLKKDREAGNLSKYTKKERVLIDKDIARLERFFGGISTLTKVPDALFIVDIGKEKGAVLEARTKELPVVAVVDSNNDPSLVTYPIAANDDAVKSIMLIVSLIGKAYEEGKELLKKNKTEVKAPAVKVADKE